MATSSNTSATTPKDQYVQGLINNQNIPAGQAGSPWSASGTPSTPSSTPTSTNSLTSARESYLGSFNPSDSLNTARQTYLNSLSPDAGVSIAKKKYLDFVTNEKLGENALEGQGRGIPLQIVRGQQSKLRTQSELEASRLQGDVGIAEDEATTLQNKAKAGLDFANTDYGYSQDKAKTNLGFANEDQTTSNTNKEFNIKNNVTQPFYKNGSQVINASTGQPEYEIVNINGNPTYKRLSDQKLYSNKEELFKDAGITSFDQVQNDIGPTVTATNKLLSPTEAKALGVPYGTTQAQAAKLGITPTTAKKTGASATTSSGTNTGMDVYVKKLIALHPGVGQVGGRNNVPNGAQWDLVANAIDAKFGDGTATKYDDLLHKAYAIKPKAPTASSSFSGGIDFNSF